MNDKVTYRQNADKSCSVIALEDTFELTKEEFEKLPIHNKFSAMWNQKYIDLSMFKYSYLAGIFLYIFLSVTELYILRNHVIAAVFDDPYERYWYRVVCCYLFYISTAHWLCVLLYDSNWTPTNQDSVALQNKTLWEDYDEILESSRKKRVLDKSLITETKHINRMVEYLPEEESGLRWRFCVICQCDAPPRAHHCVVCNKCILKRDHHCFITGRCIGYCNQRYFYFLCLFAFINSVIGVVAGAYYIIYHSAIGSQSMWGSLFIIKSVYMWLWTKELESFLFIIILHLYIFPIIGAMCFGFVSIQTVVILKGLTSDEFKNHQDIKVNIGFRQRWHEVFGRFWILNFFMPSQILFKLEGNGTDWPGLISLKGLMSLKQYK